MTVPYTEEELRRQEEHRLLVALGMRLARALHTNMQDALNDQAPHSPHLRILGRMLRATTRMHLMALQLADQEEILGNAWEVLLMLEAHADQREEEEEESEEEEVPDLVPALD